MTNPWFKFYGGEFLFDPKLDDFTDSEISCWIVLLSYASVSDIPGVVRHISEDKLLKRARVTTQWETTVGVLKKFEKLGMITISNDVIEISNWNKRQERSSTQYERVKKFRERNKLKQIETDDNDDNETDNVVEKKREEENRKEEIRLFELWWSTYPSTKRNLKKSDAEKKFLKDHSPPDVLQKRIEHLQAQKTKDRKWLAGFIPNMSTYLNQERWNMEIEVETKGNQRKVHVG